MKIGFIGIGVMGHSIVGHLLDAGHHVTLYTRTKSKATDLMARGVVFTMVGYPSDVEMTYFDEHTGLFAADIAGKTFVDLTTSTPTLAEAIYATARANNANSLDAPVSGGDLGARNGTLTVMVGGEKATYQQVLPLFKHFAKV